MTITRMPQSKVFKQHPLSATNPFDSDSESEQKPPRASSAPVASKGNYSTSLPASSENESRASSENESRGAPSSSSYSSAAAAKNRYRNDFRDLGGVENQSVQELEGYSVYKAEETTRKVNSCVKIAEEIREDATRTLVTLHQQGEQITRTHVTAANIEHDLSRGEKLLGSLGGLFSRTWKPKKAREIKGPVLTRDDSYIRRNNHTEQRQRLGLSSSPTKLRSNAHHYSSESSPALEKVQIEKAKQDDGLSDLSNLLGELKNMAVDMGSEIERQNKALDHLDDDVQELNFRVKGANIQGRRLLGK